MPKKTPGEIRESAQRAQERYRENHREDIRQNGLKYYYKHRDKRMAYAEEYRSTRIEQNILIRTRSRAKRLGMLFDLTIADVVIPEICPVLNIPIVRTSGTVGPHSPSIDKINPKQGYVRGNIRIISARANTLKNNGTAAEMKLICEDLERIERGLHT